MRYPFLIFTAMGREIRGLVFYHSNYIQNQKLRNEVDLLNQRLNILDEAKTENQRLKQLLSFKQEAAYKVIAVQVIGRSPDNWVSAIIINKGRNNAIKPGFVAISYSGLLGRVVEVTESTSKVMLVNDPLFSVSTIIQRSRQEGLVSGTLGSSLIMKYLPKDADVAVGDNVLTSGLTPNYPKGIMVGTVTEIGEEFSGLSRYAIIKPVSNLSSVEELLIIMK